MHASYKVKATGALKTYILSGHCSSEFVTKTPTQSMLDSGSYKLNPKPGSKKTMYKTSYDDTRQLPGRTYFVERKALRSDGKNNIIHEFFIPDDTNEWPSVNNRKFTVYLIPTPPTVRFCTELCDRTFASREL